MFSKKKEIPKIDKEQLELIKNAERRIKQKRGLYIHFVIFLIGAVFLIVANVGLDIGKDYKILGIDWFVYAILIWLFLFVYHFINVFITHKFMGKDWEEQQLERLVAKQKDRLEQLRKKVESEYPVYSQEENVKSTPKFRNKKQNVTIIAAAGEDNSIGKDNELVWHLKDDLQRFKALTSGHHIIMGRKTFETFPKPLPNRTHVVITRQENYKVPEGVVVVSNLHDALDVAINDNQPFIIGGGEIYRQSLDIADSIELTRVHSTFEADTFFPEIDSLQWHEVARKFHEADEDNQFPFSFITYRKVE